MIGYSYAKLLLLQILVSDINYVGAIVYITQTFTLFMSLLTALGLYSQRVLDLVRS